MSDIIPGCRERTNFIVFQVCKNLSMDFRHSKRLKDVYERCLYNNYTKKKHAI